MGSVERSARSRNPTGAVLQIRAARGCGRRGPGPVWQLGQRSDLWLCVEAHCGSGLGPVPLRPLDMDRLLRLDMGKLRSVGLGAISLRPLVFCSAVWLVLVAGGIRRPPLLASRAGGIFRLGRLWRDQRRVRLRVGTRWVGAASAL